MPFHQLFVQLTFATVQRAPLIKVELEDRVFKTLEDRCKGLECRPVAVGGMPDHVHLLVELPPALSVCALAGEVMSASSEVMQQALGPKVPFQWQEAFGAITLRMDEVDGVARYIANQKDLHLHGKLSKVLERAN